MLMRRLRYWMKNGTRSAALREEVELHLAERAAELEAHGWTPEDARAEARRRFGNVTVTHEASREIWIPRFASALGIGANIAIFTVVNAVLLRPLPFPQPERLVRVFADLNGTGAKDVGLSVSELDDLRDRSGLFDGVSVTFPVSTALRGSDRAERVEMLGTSVEYFRLPGVSAALGRTIEPSDAVPGFTEAAVISDGLWRRQFGADPLVIGRRILVDE